MIKEYKSKPEIIRALQVSNENILDLLMFAKTYGNKSCKIRVSINSVNGKEEDVSVGLIYSSKKGESSSHAWITVEEGDYIVVKDNHDIFKIKEDEFKELYDEV